MVRFVVKNAAFKKNGRHGSRVASLLQKRDHPIDIVPDWVHLNRTEEGHTMNSYFVDHPEMVLGDTVLESTPYGKDDITVRPIPGAELSDLLKRGGFPHSGNLSGRKPPC